MEEGADPNADEEADTSEEGGADTPVEEGVDPPVDKWANLSAEDGADTSARRPSKALPHKAAEMQPKSLHNDIYVKVLSKDAAGLMRLLEGVSLERGLVVQGKQVLTHAIERANLATVRVLLDAKAPLDLVYRDAREGRRECPLITTIRLNKQEIFEELLQRGCSLQDPALAWQCLRERRYCLLQLLMDHGLDYTFMHLMLATPSHLLSPHVLKFTAQSLELVLDAGIDVSPWQARCSPIRRDGSFLVSRAGAVLLASAGCRLHHSPELQVLDSEATQDVPALLERFAPPLPLKSLSRIAIRLRLAALHSYAPLRKQYSDDARSVVLSLGIPHYLIGYILFEEERQDYCRNKLQPPQMFCVQWD